MIIAWLTLLVQFNPFNPIDFDQFKNDSGAKAACETTKRTIDNDFVDVNKIVDAGATRKPIKGSNSTPLKTKPVTMHLRYLHSNG